MDNQTQILYRNKIFERCAKTAVNSSSMRNQVKKGMIKKIRLYLINKIEINKIPFAKGKYTKFLDKHTITIREECFKKSKYYWGSARKALNLFMRDCIYNNVLDKEYKLSKYTNRLEIPIDKNVYKGLKKIFDFTWKGYKFSIKKLYEDKHSELQNYAKQLSKKLGCKPVELDIFLWIDDDNTVNKLNKIYRDKLM